VVRITGIALGCIGSTIAFGAVVRNPAMIAAWLVVMLKRLHMLRRSMDVRWHRLSI
jgi:hypothetical protein